MESDDISPLHALGNFCVLMGIALVGLFVFSDIGKAPDGNLLAAGALLLIVGLFLRFAHAPAPPPPSTRFRMLRERKEKKDKKTKKDNAQKG